jgi:hypothetical protein
LSTAGANFGGAELATPGAVGDGLQESERFAKRDGCSDGSIGAVVDVRLTTVGGGRLGRDGSDVTSVSGNVATM